MLGKKKIFKSRIALFQAVYSYWHNSPYRLNQVFNTLGYILQRGYDMRWCQDMATVLEARFEDYMAKLSSNDALSLENSLVVCAMLEIDLGLLSLGQAKFQYGKIGLMFADESATGYLRAKLDSLYN